jgi:sporulation protein YlmC with PRC-barrel domain
MSKVFATTLAGKEIVTVEGTVVGGLENIILDLGTGNLIDLVVKPNKELNRQRYREEGKFVLIPFQAVVAVKDYIVVDESRAIMKPQAQISDSKEALDQPQQL